MKLKYGEAIREALFRALENDPSVVLFGEDIQHNLYGYTGQLLQSFGEKRVRNTPLSEAAVVGTAIGAAMCGLRPIVDMTVTNFLYVAMDQIASMAAKTHYMYGGQFNVPLTLMASSLQGSQSGAQHSDRPHPLFMNLPGLKVVVPACPQDAYSLLRAAIVDKNPVMYFTDRTLFYTEEDVDLNRDVAIGQAAVLRKGTDITLIGISGGTRTALDTLPLLTERHISAEVVDVRSLVPLDMDTIKESVRKTGRVVIVDTANKTCSAASEISARLAEDLFSALRAPIGIVAHDDVPVPFGTILETQLLPTKDKVIRKVECILKYNE